MKRIKVAFVILASLLAASLVSLVVHEGGHAVTARAFGADITRVQLFWLQFVDDPQTGWGVRWETWELGGDYFGSVRWTEGDPPPTTWQRGLSKLMGSGSSTLLGLSALAFLLWRPRPSRFPWLTVFIVLVAVADIFTYAVVPMVGNYVTLANPEMTYDMACPGDPVPPRLLADQLASLPVAAPQVRSVYVECRETAALPHLLVLFPEPPDVERMTQLFAQIATPNGTRWHTSADARSVAGGELVIWEFRFWLPPGEGQYEVRQAFIVLNGLRRFILAYDMVRPNGFVDPEPLYGATWMNINPYAFLAGVTALTLLQLVLLTRYALRYRRRE